MNDKLIVFKVGTSSITQANGQIDHSKIKTITTQLTHLHQKGYDLVLVTSGAIAAGFGALGFEKRPTKIAEKQASAAVGQGLLIEEYTQQFMKDNIVCAQVLLTQDDFADARRYKNAYSTLQVLLKRRAIPIINENDTIAIDEIKVGDNDTLSAQVASLIKADLLVLLTDVDGLYTDNPRKNPDSKHLSIIETISQELFDMASGAGTTNGTGGMTTKINAAQIATKSGVPVYICSSVLENALINAVTQTNKGTLFLADVHAMTQRKQWLAFYARTDASVTIDDGASHAMLHQGSSLLAAGITGVHGDFEVGDIIAVYDKDGTQAIGKGKVRLSSHDLSTGQSTGVFIHRNDWVTL